MTKDRDKLPLQTHQDFEKADMRSQTNLSDWTFFS